MFGRQRTLEDLIALILRDIRSESERQFGQPIKHVVAGRPVRFVEADEPQDDLFAQSRLELALRTAGFEDITFEFEPIGASFHYQSTLDHDELLMIGDFGGGTSDFSLIRDGPGIRKRGRRPEDLLVNDGVGVAGDSFDARIIRHLVSPALGDGTSYPFLGQGICPFPPGSIEGSNAGIISPCCGEKKSWTCCRASGRKPSSPSGSKRFST